MSYLEAYYHRGLFRDMTTALSGKVLWETHGTLFLNRRNVVWTGPEPKDIEEKDTAA